MKQVTIGNEFFKKERKNYSNWKSAFFRELIQNSVDAGATKINITLQDGGFEDSTIVKYSDNGTGFNADVRDNVFFCLGETNKGKDGDVGGFGKARIVICFAQNNYQIMSQDWRAWGEGGSYEVDTIPYFKGCSMMIDVDAKQDELYRALDSYLSTSQLSCEITVNGIKWNRWCYRRNFTQSLSFGDVYVNKSGGTHPGYVIVRVNGIPMFSRYAGMGPQVVVEIDADKSRDVLLSNRDMLQSTYQTELDEFVRKISIDTVSGLRKDRRKWIVYPGNAKVTHRKKKVKEFAKITAIQNPTGEIRFRQIEAPKPIPHDSNYEIDEQEIMDEHRIDDIIPSAIVLLESDNPKVRKVFPRYDMRFWDGIDDGGNRKKLLRQWTIICDIAVEEYLGLRNEEEMSWRPGFVFSDNSDAKYTTNNDGKDSIFLLNPVDDDGKIKFGLRNKDSWTKLILLACHEVVHHSEDYHNESFVSVSEHLFEKLFCRREEIFRALKKSLQKIKVMV